MFNHWDNNVKEDLIYIEYIYIILQNITNMDFNIINKYCPLPYIQMYKLNNHPINCTLYMEKYIIDINPKQENSLVINIMYKLNNLYIQYIQFYNLIYFNDYYNNEWNLHNRKEDINHISHLYMNYKSFGILNF